MKVIKKLIIKSYTRDYYTERLDFIETRRMKESIDHEVKAFLRYFISYCWLYFYTLLIDCVINSFILLGMALYQGAILIVAYILFVLIRKL